MTFQAVVKRKGKARTGRGFSQEELREAGLSLKQALKLGVPIDARRRSKHKENIEILKKHLERAQNSEGDHA